MEIDWKKKYNEALEKIKRYTIDDYGCTRLKSTDIFPELSESDDERIRKMLIARVRTAEELTEQLREWIIAYLEKQKAVNEKESFAWTRHDEAVRKEAIACLENWKDAIIRVGGLVDYENILAWLKEELPEKQKEQTEELSTRLNGLMQEYVKSGKDEEEQEHRLKCYQLFWDAIGDSEFFKQKEQKSAEWSEEDERMLSRCIKSVECSKQFADSESYKAAKDVEMNWLKSLLERFSLQPKPEWSEEDENRFNNLCCIIREAEGWNEVSKNAFIDWLKSLRPQPRWKPSEEQMRAFHELLGDKVPRAPELYELYNDLEKLM